MNPSFVKSLVPNKHFDLTTFKEEQMLFKFISNFKCYSVDVTIKLSQLDNTLLLNMLADSLASFDKDGWKNSLKSSDQCPIFYIDVSEFFKGMEPSYINFMIENVHTSNEAYILFIRDLFLRYDALITSNRLHFLNKINEIKAKSGNPGIKGSLCHRDPFIYRGYFNFERLL